MMVFLCMGVAEADLPLQSFSVNPFRVANPNPGVGGGQAPELVDHHRFFLLVCLFLLQGVCFFQRKLNSCQVWNAYFVWWQPSLLFISEESQSKGIVWMYKAFLLQKRNAFACRLWCNSAFCSISFHSFCFSLSASVTVYTTPHFPVCD